MCICLSTNFLPNDGRDSWLEILYFEYTEWTWYWTEFHLHNYCDVKESLWFYISIVVTFSLLANRSFSYSFTYFSTFFLILKSIYCLNAFLSIIWALLRNNFSAKAHILDGRYHGASGRTKVRRIDLEVLSLDFHPHVYSKIAYTDLL